VFPYNRHVAPVGDSAPVKRPLPIPYIFRLFASPYALLAMACLMWAGNWVAARAIRLDSGPNVMALGRWMVALAIIVPLAWPHLRRDWPVIRANRGLLVLVSVIGGAGYNALSYAGVAHTTAINAMLLNATVPFFIMGLSWLALGETMRRSQIAGMMLCFAGAFWVIVAGDMTRAATLTFNPGDLIVCLAMLLWAAYTVLIIKRPFAMHPTSFVAVLSLISVLALVPPAAWEASSRQLNLTPTVFACYIYMGIGPSVLCFLFWNRGVAAIGPNRSGMFLNLVPVLGSVLSVIVLGERPQIYHAVGFALVLGGLAVGSRRRT